jgi:hypothetical protein
MGHELRPRQGSIPPAAEILRLLSKEFDYVKADPDEGMRRALAVAEWIESRPSRVCYGRHVRALEGAQRLRNLAPGEALLIEFGDAPGRNVLKLMVLPGGSLSFGYASREEEESARELVSRCVRALDCDVVEF